MTARFYRPGVAVLAFFLMLAMLACAIGIGAYRSFTGERAPVEQERVILLQLVSARRGAAHNVLTVASRHLPADDAGAAALRTALNTQVDNLPMDKQWALDDTITRATRDILDSLQALDSVKNDDRDRMYVTQLLPQALEQSAALLADAGYNNAASAFNGKLATQFSGRVARLLGIAPYPLFGEEGGGI